MTEKTHATSAGIEPESGGRFPRATEGVAVDTQGHRFRGGLTEDGPEPEGGYRKLGVSEDTEGHEIK